MTHDPNGAPGHGSLNGRLDGWKEVAAHLGRGVRTAQRWERELGLPVRRLGTGGAEVVYALKDELDAWLLRQSRLPGAQQPQEQTGSAHAAEPRRLRAWLGPAGLVFGLGLIGAWMMLRTTRPAQSSPSAEPAELEVVGNSLNALGVNHELRWSHRFEVPLTDFDPKVEAGRINLKRLSAVGDFRGTGHNDVLLARNADLDPLMYWFDSAGRLVRTHRIEADVSFGRQRCTSIRFSHLFTKADRSEPRVFWIAGHELGGSYPAVLQSLDASGRVRSEYLERGVHWRDGGCPDERPPVDSGGQRRERDRRRRARGV